MRTSPVGSAPAGMSRCKPGQKTRRVRRESKKYPQKRIGISKCITGFGSIPIRFVPVFRTVGPVADEPAEHAGASDTGILIKHKPRKILPYYFYTASVFFGSAPVASESAKRVRRRRRPVSGKTLPSKIPIRFETVVSGSFPLVGRPAFPVGMPGVRKCARQGRTHDLPLLSLGHAADRLLDGGRKSCRGDAPQTVSEPETCFGPALFPA